MGFDITLPSIKLPDAIGWIQRTADRFDGNDATGDGGFGRTFDSYLPQPLQVAEVTIEGAIRRAVDLVVKEERPTPDGAAITKPLDRSREASRALHDQHGMLGTRDRFHSGSGWKVWRTENWPLGQVLHGRVLQAMQGGDWKAVEGMFRELESYRHGDGFTGAIGTKVERFYDDNEWIGLAAMQAYDATGDKRYLEHAQRTFKFIKEAEHPDGGMYWLEQQRESRNTCSTAPAAQLAMELFEATKDRTYLDFAKKQSEWLDANLRDADGLYKDNVNDNGTITDWKFTYNQGTPIGLDVSLYRATGDKKYLERAKQTADATLKKFDGDGFFKQAPVFNAVFFRNLLALHAAAPDPKYIAAVDTYLDRVWKDARNPKTGLFDKGGIGLYEKKAGSVIDQGALAQLYAARALPPEKWGDLT